jgi:hypothetical protein
MFIISRSGVLLDRTNLLSINNDFGTKTTVVQGGVENYDTAKNMFEQILKAFGVEHIDILDVMGGVIFLPGKWTRLIDYLF